MARVTVYERFMNAVIVDPGFYTKLQYNGDEVYARIKTEPNDTDSNDESSSEPLSTDTIGNNGPHDGLKIANSSNDLLQNKENECDSGQIEISSENTVRISYLSRRKHALTAELDSHRRKSTKRRRLNEVMDNCHEDVPESVATTEGVLPRRTKRSITRTSKNIKRNLNGEFNEGKDGDRSEIQCSICYITCSTVDHLKRHLMWIKNDTIFKCNKCSASFSTARRMRNHRQSRCHNYGSVRARCSFFCYFCDEGFREKNHIQAHLFHKHRDLIERTAYVRIASKDQLDGITSPRAIDNTSPEDTVEYKFIDQQNMHERKLRQTTLTEFLQQPDRKESIKLIDLDNPINGRNVCKKDDNSKRQAGQMMHSRSKKSNSPPAGKLAKNIFETRSNQTRRNPATPFVQIHVPVDAFMPLLNQNVNGKEDKSDGTSIVTNFSRRNHSTFHPEKNNVSRVSITDMIRDNQFNNARTDRREANTVSPVKLAVQDAIEALRENTRSKRGNTGSCRVLKISKNTDAALLSYYKCKKLVIPLVRCDATKHVTSISSKDTPSSRTTSSTPARDNITNRRKSGTKVALKEIEVTLVQLPNALKEVIKQEVPELPALPVHNPDPIIKCKVCKKTFSSQENKREHMKLFHTAYMSSICKARFALKQKLRNHYLKQHVSHNQRKCCVCGEFFQSRLELKQHLDVHCIKFIRSHKDTVPLNSEVRCRSFKKIHGCIACGKHYWMKSCLLEHRKICRGWRKLYDDNETTDDNEKPSTSPAEPVTEDASRPEVHSPEFNTSIPIEYVDLPCNIESPSLDLPETTASTCQIQVDAETNPLDGKLNGTAAANISRTQQTVLPPLDVAGDQLQSVLPNKQPAPIKIKYPCTVCGKQYQSFKNLWQHMRTFSSIANEICETCNTAFSSKRLLRTHVNSAHIPTNSQMYAFHCKFCNQGFCKKDSVRIHELHLHATKMPAGSTEMLPRQSNVWNFNMMCSVCHLMFQNYERFIEHNIYYYKGQLYKCTFCNQTFDGMYMLHHHNKLMHYPEEARKKYSFVCEICSEGFKHEAHFLSHKVHVHSCEPCSLLDIWNTTEDHGSLNIMELHSGDGKGKLPPSISVNVCAICKLDFANSVDLAMHQLEYSNNGNYPCNQCERKCHTSEALLDHQNLNHGNFDVNDGYRCPICKEIFMSSVSLMSHEKHFHYEKTAQFTARVREVTQSTAVEMNKHAVPINAFAPEQVSHVFSFVTANYDTPGLDSYANNFVLQA